MKKRFLSMILAVVLCGLLLPVVTAAVLPERFHPHQKHLPYLPEWYLLSSWVLLGRRRWTATPMSITVLSFPMETQRLPERVRSPSLQEMLKAMFWMFPTAIPEELPEMIRSGSVEG